MQERIDRDEREHLDAMKQLTELYNSRTNTQLDESACKDADYKASLDALNKQMEALRVEKDSEIKRLTLELEEQRSTFELKINELEITVQRYQQITVKLEATVLELNTRLAQKSDVEQQLALWKEHHDSMEVSKQELQE